jgi:hypothetical protein
LKPSCGYLYSLKRIKRNSGWPLRGIETKRPG